MKERKKEREIEKNEEEERTCRSAAPTRRLTGCGKSGNFIAGNSQESSALVLPLRQGEHFLRCPEKRKNTLLPREDKLINLNLCVLVLGTHRENACFLKNGEIVSPKSFSCQLRQSLFFGSAWPMKMVRREGLFCQPWQSEDPNYGKFKKTEHSCG